MKKILLTICLVVFLVAGSQIVSAQDEITECIKLREKVTLRMPGESSDATFKKGVVIAPRKLDILECVDYSAISTQCGNTGEQSGNCYTTEFAIIVALSYLNFVITWLFYTLMLIVTIMIIYGGFLIITSAGDPEKAGKGRKAVTFAAIGLAVALLARVVPSLVRFVVGV